MRVFILLFFFLVHGLIKAQDSSIVYNSSAMLLGGSNQLPFWLRANQNGIMPLTDNGALISGRVSVYKNYVYSNPRKLQWSAGVEATGFYTNNKSGSAFFTDLYASAKLSGVELLVGQKKNITGLVDTTLTSGSLAISGNSRPVPGIQISIPEFIPLGFTNYFISIKGSYSDGKLGGSDILFGSVNHISSTFFHQKQLYLRFGKYGGRFKIYTGVNHQVVWGGEKQIWPLYDLKKIDAYWYAVSGKTLDYKKVGNHFGTYDLGAEWRGDSWSYFFYRQNIYESGSLFKVINLADGLNGFSIKRSKHSNTNSSNFALDAATFEIIGTSDQHNSFSSPSLIFYQTGNYFNHYIYARGWSYFGRNMGTPLVSDKGSLNPDLNQSMSQFTNNNRIWAFHGGLAGNWLKTNFTFKGTYSRNFGTYLNAFNKTQSQISLLLSIEKKVSFLNSSLSAGIASDFGTLYPKTSTLFIGIKRTGYIN